MSHDHHATILKAVFKCVNRSSDFHFYYFYLYDPRRKKVHQHLMTTYLEFHGRVLLILWCCVALVVEVVGGGGVNDG